MPKVSVIICTYNRAHFLPEAIESVLNQSFRDFEIIIVDDGSTDNTPEVISAYPVKYIYQENQGLSIARNKGIECSDGEYIVWPDSDDILLPTALAKGVVLLDIHSEVAFSYGQGYLMDEEGNIFGFRKHPSLKQSCIRKGTELIGELIFGNRILSPTAMVRRSCLEDVGVFNPAFRHGSVDFELWVRIAKKYAVGYIAEPLAKYRVHANTMSGTRQLEEVERSNSIIMESVFDDPEFSSIFSHQRASAFSHLRFRMAMRAYADHRDMKAARKYLFKAAKMYPKGFFRGQVLQWTLLLAKTCVPLPILAFIRRSRRHLRIAIRRGQ